MFKKYITLVIFGALLFLPISVMAQVPDACGCTGPFVCNATMDGCILVGPGVPVDGGLVILLAAGVAFGIKKLLDSKKSLS